MGQFETGSLAGRKRLLGLAALLVVIAGAIAVGVTLQYRISSTPLSAVYLHPVIVPIFGFLLLMVGAVLWVIVVLTRCFTFDFLRSYLDSYRKRLIPALIVVSLPIQGGFALMMAPTVAWIIDSIFPSSLTTPIAILLPFLTAQMFFVWFQLLCPLETSPIRRRARACGLTPEQIASGYPIGISNPDRNSFRKFTIIEEDLGLLWLAPDRLIFRGDTEGFDIAREDLLEIERRSDAGNTAAYFGAIDVVLHVRLADGTIRKIRLHPEGFWTMTGKAKARNQLAQMLEAWKINVPMAVGFPVGAAQSPREQ